MVSLSLKDTGTYLGVIDEDDLRLLIDQLEEEHAKDTDYYVCSTTIDILEENGGSSRLIQLLRSAVGDSEGVEIIWEKK